MKYFSIVGTATNGGNDHPKLSYFSLLSRDVVMASQTTNPVNGSATSPCTSTTTICYPFMMLCVQKAS